MKIIPANRKPYPDAGAYRLPLSKGKVALIDAADVPLVDNDLWVWDKTHGPMTTPGRTKKLLGLVILGIPKGARVLHRNHDRLDFRRTNLVVGDRPRAAWMARKATRRGESPCTSVYKGVCYDRQTGRWKAYIRSGRHRLNLGRHPDERQAAAAYDAQARRLFGSFARLNFPDPDPLTPESHDAQPAPALC